MSFHGSSVPTDYDSVPQTIHEFAKQTMETHKLDISQAPTKFTFFKDLVKQLEQDGILKSSSPEPTPSTSALPDTPEASAASASYKADVTTSKLISSITPKPSYLSQVKHHLAKLQQKEVEPPTKIDLTTFISTDIDNTEIVNLEDIQFLVDSGTSSVPFNIVLNDPDEDILETQEASDTPATHPPHNPQPALDVLGQEHTRALDTIKSQNSELCRYKQKILQLENKISTGKSHPLHSSSIYGHVLI